MKNKEKKEDIICQRCQKNQISFLCNSCPKPFDKLCFECDTYVHSIIPYKKFHQRTNFIINNNIENSNKKDDNNAKNNLINEYQKHLKELEEKCHFQIDLINKLKSENNILKNNIVKLNVEIII
jgi:hypothetical protein